MAQVYRPTKAIFPREMRLAGAIRDGWTCRLCGRPVQNLNPKADDYLVAGHIVAWVDGGADTMDNLRTECKRCSEAGGSEIAAQRRATERANAGATPTTPRRRAKKRSTKINSSGFFNEAPAPDGRPLTSVAPESTTEPPKPVAPLQLSQPADFADCPWMTDLLDVPEDATWPRLMTGPHPAAIGSYGADLEKCSRDRDGTVLRWWQRLSMRRALEYGADGELVWPEWIWSSARQQGKSVGIRELSMWRIQRAALIGEMQEVSFLSSVMRTANLIQRPARSWAKTHKEEGWNAREMNGAQTVQAPDGSTWAIHSPTSIFGSSAGLAVVDEGWKIDPVVVTDALEPTLSERQWPQLALISTAHVNPTALMVDRRNTALTDFSTLLMEWSAHPGCELDDVDEWRLASPHWHPRREALIRRALNRALAAPNVVDGMDPVAGFRAHWLNQWPSKSVRHVRVPGLSLVPDGVWPALAGDADAEGPISFAVEDLFGRAVAVAAAGKTADGRTVLEAYELGDRRVAWQWIRGHAAVRPGCSVIVGPALSNDPDLIELGVPVTVSTYTTTRQALSRFRASASRQSIVHVNSPLLGAQLDALRVVEGQSGLRVVSSDPWEILRAATWAVLAAETAIRGVPSVW